MIAYSGTRPPAVVYATPDDWGLVENSLRLVGYHFWVHYNIAAIMVEGKEYMCNATIIYDRTALESLIEHRKDIIIKL